MRPQLGVDADLGWSGSGNGGVAVLPEARVTQLVYDGGRTPSEIRRRKIRVETLEAQQQLVLAELATQLADAWIAWSRARDLLVVSRDQVAALDELQGLVVEIANFDRGRMSDVVLVQARLQQAVTTQQLREIAFEEAGARIREVSSQPVEPEGDVADLSAHLPLSAEASGDMVAATPALRRAELQVAETAEAERGSRRWWAPRLALEGARTSEIDSQGDVKLLNDFALRLRLVAVPFDSGGGSARLIAARAQREAAQADAEQVRLALRDQVQRLWTVQARRSERLPAMTDLVDRADEAREVVFQQFRIGRRSILDVLSYDLDRFNVRSQLVNERHDITLAQYQLLGVLGRIYPAVQDVAGAS